MKIDERLVAGARTVTGIAAHFEELKRQTLRLLDTSEASSRGFFTPSEDDDVRHVLVSYWQSRNALIELVVSCHDDTDCPQDQRPAAFLVAYSGALVLIDAARFLRKHMHDRPVALAKLNEPAPEFGIPAGTYDRIQKSLTSPVHAWHLYHAARYFEQQRETLEKRVSQDSLLTSLVELIDRLEHTLNVSVSDYTVARLDVRTREMITAVGRDLLSRALYGLQKSVSRLISDVYTMPGHHPELPEVVRGRLHALLQPGDVLITRKEHALTNYFLPGYWPHAALYLGDAHQLEELGVAEHDHAKSRWTRLLECDAHQPRRVLEAMKDGVWIRSLASPFSSDALAVLRPQLSPGEVAESLTRGLSHDGKPYDFDFDFTRSDRLVCTEVVYRSYENIGGIRFQLTRRAGRYTLAAEDLIQMALDRTHFEPVAVYAPSHAANLLSGTEAEAVIRETHATWSVDQTNA